MSRVLFGLVLPCALFASLTMGIPAAYRAGQREARAAAARHERDAVDFAITETLRRSAGPQSPACPALSRDDGENQ